MKKFFFLILFFFFQLNLFSQVGFDSAVFDNNFEFKNGIYTSFEELKYNSPRYPDAELELNKDQELKNTDQLYYFNVFKTRLKFESRLYATVVDGRLSVFYKDQLNSIFLKGAISTFILKEIVTTTNYQPQPSYGYGNPGYGSPSVPITTSSLEVNIYFLDFITGIIAKVDRDNLEPIIQRDALLYDSFKKIKGDANNKKSYPFISQYNTRNPVYIMILHVNDIENE